MTEKFTPTRTAACEEDMEPAVRLPLAGVRVLDLTIARAGPTCVRHLADWGADVIRVEMPGHRDTLGSARDSSDQINLHRNKRCIALDLKHPDGHAAFLRLVRNADVVVENMRTQVKHRLKIAYDDLKPVNARLIYGSLSGFGQTGPYAGRAGLDQITQGMGGLMSVTGEPGRGPMRVGIAINDLTAGNLLAMGIMMKLFDRERTGRGGNVQTSLLEAQVFMLDFQATRWLMDGVVPVQSGNDHPVFIPMGVFPTADKPINIAASPRFWEAFSRGCGHPEWLDDPQWKTAEGRGADRPRINATIAEVTKTRPSQWWVETMEEAGVPCGPVNDIREVFEDPQVAHLGIATPMRHRTRGDIRVVGQPVRLEGVSTGVYRDAPNHGEHNEEVLAEAGFSETEIRDLVANGAVARTKETT